MGNSMEGTVKFSLDANPTVAEAMVREGHCHMNSGIFLDYVIYGVMLPAAMISAVIHLYILPVMLVYQTIQNRMHAALWIKCLKTTWIIVMI